MDFEAGPCMTRLSLSEAARRERSERMNRLNADQEFAARRDAATSRRSERTKAAQWLQRFQNSKGGHDADQINEILGGIREKFEAGGVIIDDKILEEVKEQVSSRTPPKKGRARLEEPMANSGASGTRTTSTTPIEGETAHR